MHPIDLTLVRLFVQFTSPANPNAPAIAANISSPKSLRTGRKTKKNKLKVDARIIVEVIFSRRKNRTNRIKQIDVENSERNSYKKVLT